MNDSFLEDLGLISPSAKNVNAYPLDRHVTTRTATSSPLHTLAQHKDENVHLKLEQPTYAERQSTIKELTTKDLKKISEHEIRKQQAKVKMAIRKEKTMETKLKPIENKVKNDGREQELKDDMNKGKIRESKVKISETKGITKERSRRTGSYKENTHISDIKENSRPSDINKDGSPQVEAVKEKLKAHETNKKAELKEADPAVLNAIKEIVSTCAKQESTKIIKSMQLLHFNSQANLIKHLMSQTDDIISEMHPSRDLTRIKGLIEQNERLQEDNIILQKKYEELLKRLEGLEYLKQENVALKLKCKELSKQ